MAITQKTRDADEKLREELRHADIGKLKKLMTPLIEKNAGRKLNEKKNERGTAQKNAKHTDVGRPRD